VGRRAHRGRLAARLHPGRGHLWRRPGKDHGISATTGYQGDWLYVFTSSTVLEPERTYTRFGYRAAWSHGGDHHAAADALQRAGYGKKATVVQLPVPAPSTPLAPTADGTVPVPATDGDGHRHAR
jgi:putative DNA primase/helicase